MIRLGIHYLEPRRVGFFVVEESLLWLAFVLAAQLVGRLTGAALDLPSLLGPALTFVALLEAGLYFASLHDLRTALADASDGRRLFYVLGAAMLFQSLAVWMGLSSIQPPLLAGLGAACTATLWLRYALPQLTLRLRLRTRILLVGSGRMARQLIREVARDGGVEITGYASSEATGLAAQLKSAGADLLVVATDDQRGLPMAELLACRVEGRSVMAAGTFATRALCRLPVELVRPSELVFNDGFARPLWLRWTRRALSMAVSLLLLIATLPLLILAMLAIRLDSPGPVLFLQPRVGLGGKVFSIFKLRTMTPDAESGGAVWARPHDPRVTRVGRWLRRYRIDELPQLWNVLHGDMEIVGPRPERPEFVADLAQKIPYYSLRSLVRPGITGWAQVKYPYAASLQEAREKLQYDLYFVRHLSLSLDLFILLLTAKVVISGRGAR